MDSEEEDDDDYAVDAAAADDDADAEDDGERALKNVHRARIRRWTVRAS